MIFLNESIYEYRNKWGNFPVILFGAGAYLDDMLEYIPWFFYKLKLLYIVDNNWQNFKDGRTINGHKIEIKSPQYLENETERFALIIMNAKWTWEIYEQIQSMRLMDDSVCFSFTEMQSVSSGKMPYIENKGEQGIEKIIHSFWFSGEEKPDDYKRCIESWHLCCPDFEIKEWDLHSYHSDNPFFNEAIKNKKWAFASDYSRLDIIYKYGGIYLDMDVELKRDLTPLLGHKAFFSYDTINLVDLGAGFGSVKNNIFIKKLRSIYDEEMFYKDWEHLPKMAQPRIIRDVFIENEFRLTGDYEEKNGIVIYPRAYFAPEDCWTYIDHIKQGVEYGIHHYISGWRPSDFRVKSMNDHRRLQEIFSKNH